MYRITDPHHPELANSIRQAVSQCLRAHPQSHVYALIDATLDMEWAQQLWATAQAKPDQVQSIYQDTELAGLQECSLFVAHIHDKDFDAVLQHGMGGPMLSFVQTTLALDQLRQHFTRFARARTADGQWLVARWGCPVVAPAIISVLTPAQKALLCSGFCAWYLINRQGKLDTVQGSMDAALAMGEHGTDGMLEHGYAMGDEAFAALVDSCEADGMLHTIAQSAPQVLQGRTPSMLHGMATYVLNRMKELGIPQGQSQIQLLAQALMQPSADAALALLKAHQANSTAAA